MTKVLLVDDDAKTRDVLKRRLTVEGYQVVEAADAESALLEYRQSPSDLVVADLRLPGNSGEQLIYDLRREHGAVRVIAISGAPERLAALEAEQPLMKTLVKPFTSEQLLEALGGVMGGAAPSSVWTRLRAFVRLLMSPS
jgi:two-component system response regulator RegX3